MKKKKETEFDKLARLIKEEGEDIREQIATDIAGVRRDMSTRDDVASIYRVMATKEDIAEVRRDMATKGDVEDAREEVLEVLRPYRRAVDKDALAIVDHGVRLVRIEEKLGLSSKK